MKMLPSASTYLLLGVLSWGSASPKSTRGHLWIPEASEQRPRQALRPWRFLFTLGVGAVEAPPAPAPGLTFNFTPGVPCGTWPEPGGPGRAAPGPLAAPSPGRCPERALGTTPFSTKAHTTSPAASYRNCAPQPPPGISRRLTLLHDPATLIKLSFLLYLAPPP